MIKRATDPYAALRYPEFVNIISGTFLLTMALLIQEVIVSYELYRMTHSKMVLGMIGLVQAGPYIAMALFSGHLADRISRIWIMRIAVLGTALCSALFLYLFQPEVQLQLGQQKLLWSIYGVMALIGVARSFYGPATSALRAMIIPREHYANASSWSSSFWQVGAILGPGVAGFMYLGWGLQGTLLFCFVTVSVVLVCLIFVKNRPAPKNAQQGNLWESIREGIQFVAKAKILLYAISLDLAAVLFGGVIAILPVFAEDILKVGPEGLGILRAAPAVGAVLMLVVAAYIPVTRQAWRNMLLSVAAFGVATLVFAISTNFWLSVFMLFLTGLFDSVSILVRGTILQVIPPDHLRGRVTAVNSIFVSSSNEIGAFESGMAAQMLGTIPSVLLGATLTLGIVGWVWMKSDDLFDVKLD